MKRKLFFITFLMLFCSSMFGQHWTMTEADEALYNSNMTVTTVIEINGEEQRRTDLEIAAFCNNGLRGVGEIQYKESTDRYIATITILGGNVSGETINFKLFDPELDNGKELNTTFTVNFVTDEVIGKPSSPISINFNNTYWSIDISNLPITSMQYTSYIKIDGEEQRRTDLELAAFSGETLCGWVQPIYSSKADKFVAFLTIYGEEGDEITLKLYDPELEGGKVLTADSPFGFLNNNMVGNPTTPLEFKNNPVARIGEEGNAARYFSSLEAAVDAAQPGETVVLLQDVNLTETLTIEKSITIDLNDKNVTLSTGGNMIESDVIIKNGNLAIADVDTQTTGNRNCFISTNVGASLTFDDINMTGNGYTTHWAVLCAMSSSTAGSTINITNSTVTLSNENGSAGGFIKDQSGVDNYSQINISNSTLTLTNVSRGFTGAKVTLNDVDLTITGGEHGINGSELVIKNGSNVSISNGIGRAITLNKFDASIAGSNVTISNMGEGGIRYKTANTLTVDASSKLSETTAHADVDNAKLNDKVVRGTESQMSTVKVEDGVTTVINPVSGQVAYRAYIEDSENREAVKVDLQNVNALNSLAVKLYDANGNLLTTTTYRAGAVEAPEYLTCNIVLSGTASSSWETVISAEKLTVDNYPHKAELVVDGDVINTFENILGNATDAAAYQLPAYKALGCVYKAASITKESKTEYYGTLAAAVNAAQDGDEIVLLDNVTDVDATISKKITLNLNEKIINDAYIIVKSEVNIKNGSIKNVNESYPLVVQGGGKLTVDAVNIEASKSDRAIWVRSGSSLVFNSGSILATKGEYNTKTSLFAAIYTDTNTDVTINGGTITVDTPENKAVGIFGNYTNANVTVNGAKISTSGNGYNYGINVDGDITVNGGEIVTNEKGYAYPSGIRYGNNYALVSATGDVTITGGNITTNGFSGYIVNVGRTYSSNDQTVSITGGTFVNNLSEVEMTTGGHKAPVLVWTGTASTVTATVEDGNFQGFSANLLRKDNDDEKTTLQVSGGTFDVAIEGKYIAPGFKLEENDNGTYGVVVDPAYGKVAKIGDTYYETLAEAIAAVDAGNVVIELVNDATLDYNAREAYGTAETTSLTINGNGKTLTLNQKNSDWSSFGLANADAKVVFNNMIIEKTGYGDTSGAWNTHTIIFSSKVEMNDVTVNNSMAVQNGATLNDVTINEANGYYGLWINGNGQSVTMNGGSINATNGGRGIKIADQYIDAPALVTLSVTGTTFNTAKKAAVLVSSKAGAAIAASNVNIENVAEDKVNFAWVDEDWAAHYGEVTVTGGTVSQESVENFNVTITDNNNAIQGYYKNIATAIADAQAGETVNLLDNYNETLSEVLLIGKSLTINGNGKTLTSPATRVIRLTASEIEVIINNLNMVSEAVRVGTDDIRGISIDIIDNVTLTLNNCSVDFRDASANDWAYAVNVTGGNKHNVTVKGGTYEGANVINVRGENNTVIVEDATLTSLYPANDVYYGACIWVLEEKGSSVEATGNTFNGGNAVAFNLGTGTDLTESNNTDNTTKVIAKIGNELYVSLQEAINAATGDATTIVVLHNIELTQGVTVPADKTFTLDLNGKVVSGVSTTAASSSVITNNGNLTVQSSVEGGKITSKSLQPDVNWGGEGEPSYPSYANNTIVNRGTFTLVSGTVENTTAAGGATYAIDNYNGSTTNIEGGEVYCENNLAIRLFCGDNISLNIDGGKIQGTRALWIQLANSNSSVAPNVEVNISNGEIRATGEKNGYIQALYSYSYGNDMKNVEINISGGTFYGDINLTGGSNQTNIETLNISGGIFNGNEYDINSYGADEKAVGAISITGGTFSKNYAEKYALDDGFVFVKNADGKYELDELEEGDEINISNLNELIAFRDAVNAGNDFAGQTVVLTSESEYGIDLNQTRSIENWIPIGTIATPFKGTFDGGNVTISNLNVETEESYAGLFGYTIGATIKNVKINNAHVKGKSYVAAVVGHAYTGTIDNCFVGGCIQIEGHYMVGGINGAGYAKISNCTVSSGCDKLDDSHIHYIMATHKEKDLEGDNVGGIVGQAMEGNVLENNTVLYTTISGTRKVGGIVGSISRSTDVIGSFIQNLDIKTTAKNDYATDNPTSMNLGGLIGHYYNYSGENYVDGSGIVSNNKVQYISFWDNGNKIDYGVETVPNLNFGPIVGGYRGNNGGDPVVEGSSIKSENNLIYANHINMAKANTYLMNAVAQIGETKYYTLQEAVDAGNGKTINVIGNTTEVINIADNAVIDLNFSEGVTLNGYILAPNADLTINDGTISNTNSAKSAVQINAGKLELNNVNITSARHAMRIEGTNGEVIATINGGTYKLHEVASQTQHVLNAGGDGSQVTVTINNGTFVGPKGTASDSGAAINVQTGATVTIEGGDFSNGKNNTLSAAGTLIVKGGTFDQVVKGSYLAEGYVCQMNADNKYEVFFAVAKIGEVNYPSLQKAFNDVDANETITIISNVEESEVILPATLENVIVTAPENVVVKNTVIKTPEMGTTSGFAIAYEGLTFNNVNFDNSRVHLTGWANDALSQSVSIKNLVVTNCEFNNIANEENQNYAALHLNVADGVLENLTFTNNKVNGITGGESAALYGNFTGNVTITGNVIRNTSGSSMVVGYSNATINITDNILENWALSGKGRAIRLDVNNEANASTVVVRGNAMIHANAPEEFVKSTGSNTTVTLNENYWYGNSPREEGMVTAAGVVIDNYYKTCTVTNDDFELDNLVVYAKGTITHGYVNTDRIWGEGSSNSQVSFVVKVYAGETLLGQASLNDKDNIIDGDIPNVTWGIPYNTANTDEYWTVEWFEALSPSVVPTTVKLYVDGEFVAENTIKMSAPDDLNPIEWEDIFVAKIEEANTYFTSLQAAINAADGKTVVVLDNITLTETLTVAAGTTVTLDLNGKNLTGGADVNLVIKGELTIEDNVGNAVSTFRNHYVSEGGKLTLKSGILQNIETNTGGYGIFIENGGESIIEGGTVQAVNESNYAICVNGTLTIVDGNIVGNHGVIAVENPNAIVTIENGKYTLNAITGNSDHIVYVYAGMVNIEDGNFTFNNFIANEGDSMIYADKENVSITGGTYTHNVNDYCHKYYAAIQGDDNLWRVEQVLFAQTTALQGGWNWYSSYINLASDEELVEMQNAFDGKGLEIKGKTGFSDYQYIGDDENGVAQYKWYKTEDFSISAKQMYMIKTTEALDLVVDGKVVNPAANPISLKVGWNWIGYPMTENVAINVALANATDGDIIKARNGQATYSTNINPETNEIFGWVGTLTTLTPGQGYKYQSNANRVLVYSRGDRGSKYEDENITFEDNYWVPAVSEYANNMTITAMLSIDSEIVKENYEIAAFANGECRGSARPIYVEGLDSYMLFMTIYGEGVEELTFKCYDVNYGTEYELSDRINYSDDAIVGSFNEPYMFNLDILNIEESSVEDINIYPNPTTTSSEINLQAMCDKVEVFNALGVKVAEYSNVDSIDALETAGIYVIRVTIDGNARNCRLVVK